MDHGSNLAQASFAETMAAAFPSLADLLRFPEEDDGRSLADAAQRDLESALQLLAERARYVMGASGVAIALREGEEMVCRASAGPSAPPLETPLQVDSGLTAESLRQREILRCDDADNDQRVDQDSCRALGVKSVMVTPLLRQRQPIGVFELLAERSYAFEERDVTVLQRLSAMVLTALDHADAATRAVKETKAVVEEIEESGSAIATQPPAKAAILTGSTPDLTKEVGEIHRCSVCGFPVSASRSLCLDCEKGKKLEANAAEQKEEDAPVFALQNDTPAEHGWLASACYLVSIMVTVVAILWLVFRLH
jgi:GAF domain-containing protein